MLLSNLPSTKDVLTIQNLSRHRHRKDTLGGRRWATSAAVRPGVTLTVYIDLTVRSHEAILSRVAH
jgi:hypothetical protein